DGETLAVLTGRELSLWDVEAGRERTRVQLPPGTGLLSPDLTRAVTWGSYARLWDVATGQELLELKGTRFNEQASLWDLVTRRKPAYVEVGSTEPMGFSPDGRLLAIGDDTGSVRLWDLTPPSGQFVAQLGLGVAGLAVVLLLWSWVSRPRRLCLT